MFSISSIDQFIVTFADIISRSKQKEFVTTIYLLHYQQPGVNTSLYKAEGLTWSDV